MKGIRFASIGSGSSGNGTVFQTSNTTILVDCGFSGAETESRLQRAGIDPHDLDAILVTHEHSDHLRGVGVMSRRFNLPVYATRGTGQALIENVALSRSCIRRIEADSTFAVSDLEILPVAVSHDANEPTQFVVRCDDVSAGILTDIGYVDDQIMEAFSECKAMLMESNHDTEMLWTGPYPSHLKERIAGDYGHLSNDQTMDLLSTLAEGNLCQVIIGHVSKQNNDFSLLRSFYAEYKSSMDRLLFATQEAGSEWISIDG